MEGGDVTIGGHAMGGVDLQGPGQAARGAVELLVEVVAPASDGLGQQHARGGGVGEHQRVDVAAAQVQPPRDDASGEAAEEGKPALPDEQRRPRALDEPVQVRGHIREAGAQEAHADGDHGSAVDEVGVAAAGSVAAAGQVHREQHAGGDEQPVEADRQRADPDPVGGWSGDERQQAGHRGTSDSITVPAGSDGDWADRAWRAARRAFEPNSPWIAPSTRPSAPTR